MQAKDWELLTEETAYYLSDVQTKILTKIKSGDVDAGNLYYYPKPWIEKPKWSPAWKEFVDPTEAPKVEKKHISKEEIDEKLKKIWEEWKHMEILIKQQKEREKE